MEPLIRQQLVSLLPRLHRFAMGLAGSAADADDLVQAACEKAIRNIEQWQPGTRLDSWMFRIVHTHWIDSRRKIAREREASAQMAVQDIDDSHRTGSEARLMLDAVRAEVAKLPEEQRAVLMLVCVEGLTYREAAESLGIPIGTIMSRLSRARLTIGEAMSRSRPAYEENGHVKAI